jgi:Sec-independent protein translocase protein TatA
MTTGEVHLVAIMVLALLLFGYLYNLLVERLEQIGYNRGYTAFLVVVGTTVTLIASIAVIGLESVLKLMVLFAASGLPMIVGDMMRSAKQRKADEEGARRVWEEVEMEHDAEKDRRVYDASGDSECSER